MTIALSYPRISVITVCWNSAATISHTLESFFRQTWPNKELLIVDGGSTDDTLAVVSRYKADNMTVVSGPDDGMYDALNKGFGLYGGDAFGVLNADDAFHDETVLGRVADLLQTHDMVHGHLDFVQDHSAKKIVRTWQAKSRPRRGFKTGWMPAHPTFYCRRAVQEKTGLFDTRMRVAADYDWMLRAVELGGFSLDLLDYVMVDMMVGGASTRSIRAHLRHNLDCLKSRQRWLQAGAVDLALFAKPLGKLRQFI